MNLIVLGDRWLIKKLLDLFLIFREDFFGYKCLFGKELFNIF